jgi:magnesium chelatase subunit H
MKTTVLYIGSSLLAPLKNAERQLNREYSLDLSIAPYNFGATLNEDEWLAVEKDLETSDVVFVIHVMDGENSARLLPLLETNRATHRAVIVINCMPDLMRRTRMGKLDLGRLLGSGARTEEVSRTGAKTQRASEGKQDEQSERSRTKGSLGVLRTVGSWIGNQVSARRSGNGHASTRNHTRYLKLADRLPSILRFVPGAGALGDVKNYLTLFCYFLQPTPANIQSLVLYALKHYVPDKRLKAIKVAPPESMPAVAIYHPDAPAMFENFAAYEKWYRRKGVGSQGSGVGYQVSGVRSQGSGVGYQVSGVRSDRSHLNPESTIGLLLMRPQVISKATKHYDELIRAIEAEGLSTIPVLATLMDNREACEKFFIAAKGSKVQRPKTKDQSPKPKAPATDDEPLTTNSSRVSQIVSLTGFSFVGGPAMNDSEAAAEFLQSFNRPYRSAVSLDMQTIESWRGSQTGLNPVQAGMQIAIPEIDGATEPFVYGGLPARGVEPVALDDRCRRFARRLQRWNRLRTAPRAELKLALVLYCFPPNKGNVGTAADLDVFPSVWDTLKRLQAEGYVVDLPDSADQLRELLLGGNSESFGATANIAYRMPSDEYRRLCPFVSEIENDWGPAPGRVNSFGDELLIQGLRLGNVFVGVQPTFGYEGDPMRLMMARSGSPHHGFMGFYTYLEKVFGADAAVHVGTHGAMEFMPGKQVGLSGECWPDRLIGELPNIYLYSVNNPSEGSIAKRRSYAELVSYLTPPIENAGLYKDLSTLKDLVMSYRQSADVDERDRLYQSIEHYQLELNLTSASMSDKL